MEDNAKKVIIGHAQGEITEKKSRFIANVFEIHSEAEALEILESVRKKYYDARHNCYAYVLGPGSETMRFSDDKEPQGTAGKPILEVLTKQNYRNTLIIVTRYFGGILLGTGGLVRAYTASSQEGLRQAEETGSACPLFEGIPMEITCDYGAFGKIQYIINQDSIPTTGITYDAQVTCSLVVPTEKSDLLEKRITEATNAAAQITRSEAAFFIQSDDKPIPYML